MLIFFGNQFNYASTSINETWKMYKPAWLDDKLCLAHSEFHKKILNSWVPNQVGWGVLAACLSWLFEMLVHRTSRTDLKHLKNKDNIANNIHNNRILMNNLLKLWYDYYPPPQYSYINSLRQMDQKRTGHLVWQPWKHILHITWGNKVVGGDF